MLLHILLALTFLFLLFNFFITDGDYLHPSMLFCELFFVYELICVIGQSTYAITLHLQTVLVLACGLFAFTLFGILTMRKKRTACTAVQRPQYIAIPNLYIYLLIVFQILTNLAFIQYLRAIHTVYTTLDNVQEMGSGLGDLINLFDTMTKFWPDIWSQIHVSVPMIYRIGNPVTSAASYLVLYVMVNNYMACKKINWLHLAVIALSCVTILLNGSRSPLLRIITAVIILAYVFNYRKHGRRKGSLRIFFILVGTVLAVSAAMIVMLNLMGRGKHLNDILVYIFTYTGAPIVNLDTFVSSNTIHFWSGFSELFGEHTFGNLYAYIGKIFSIERFQEIESIIPFTFSSNGIEIGNVYTTFHAFIYDFGYVGVLPLICIIAYYYTRTYQTVMAKPQRRVIDFRLFIYSYLFNDLVMLSFSNRFFETICDAPFIKLFILSWLFDRIFFEHSFQLGKYRIKLPRVKIS